MLDTIPAVASMYQQPVRRNKKMEPQTLNLRSGDTLNLINESPDPIEFELTLSDGTLIVGKQIINHPISITFGDSTQGVATLIQRAKGNINPSFVID